MCSSDNFPPFFWAGSIFILIALTKHIAAVDDSMDCTPPGRPDLQCTILKTQACKDRDPRLYAAKPGDYPACARDLKIDQYQYLYTDGKYYPLLNISFKGPDDASIRIVKAFEIKLTIMSGNEVGKFVCRILDLTAANITDADSMVQTEFSLHGLSLRQQTQYLVNVRSLPEPSTTNSNTKDVYRYINTPVAEKSKRNCHTPHSRAKRSSKKERIVDVNNTANWAFFIETIFDESQLTVSFSQPPDEYKFAQFLVQLIRYDQDKDKLIEADRKVTYEYSVVFEKINLLIPGLYRVSVEPNFNRKCPCKSNGGCSICSTSITSAFNISFGIGSEAPIVTTFTTSTSTATGDTPGLSEHSTTSTQEPVNLSLLIGLSVSVVSIFLVVVLVAVILFHRRCKTGEDYCPVIESQKKPFDPDIMPAGNSPSPGPNIQDVPDGQLIEIHTKQTLLLLYFADDQDHRNAVFCLANFLEGHCSMNVYLHDWCTNEITSKGQDNWVVEKMHMVDWIVILNSEGAYEQYKHITDPCQQDSNILRDMFLCAIKMLERHTDIYRDKFISAYFPYTDKNNLIRQFTPKGIHYRLMDDIEEFFLRVNNCEKYHGNEVIDAAVANRREYHLTEPGRKLKEIINKKMNNASDAYQQMATLHEPDFEHQSNVDSGIESGFKNPMFNANTLNLKPEGLFNANWGDEDICSNSSLSLRDPDAWSCGSIGSAGRADIAKFYQDCPPDELYDPVRTGPNYRQEANEIDVVNIPRMDTIEDYVV